jgi:hypothetical protein
MIKPSARHTGMDFDIILVLRITRINIMVGIWFSNSSVIFQNGSVIMCSSCIHFSLLKINEISFWIYDLIIPSLDANRFSFGFDWSSFGFDLFVCLIELTKLTF